MKFRRMVGETRAGDITAHYRSGRWQSAVALSRAITDAVEGIVDLRRYGVTGRVCWAEPGPGWSFEADYYDLTRPIPKAAVIEELDELEIEDGPIAAPGQIRQAYFMRFNVEGLRVLRRVSTEDWPERAETVLSPDNIKNSYYFFNTDGNSLVGPPRPRFHTLIKNGFAATGGERRFGEKFGQLVPHDIILMYENGIGVVAVGTVLERWDGEAHSNLLY